jgi:hypothetical protein
LAFEILPSQYDTYLTADGPHGEFSCQVFYEEKKSGVTDGVFCSAQYMNSPNPNAPLIPFNPPPPTIIDGIKALWSTREINFGKPSFKLSLTRVFQSVGLAPLMTQSNPAGLFATYRGPSSPFQFRRDHFKNDKMTKMENSKK